MCSNVTKSRVHINETFVLSLHFIQESEAKMTIIDDFIIEQGAFFVSDSHFKTDDMKLIEYFSNFPQGKQIILMGDIFHFLVGKVDSSCLANMQLIRQIAKLTHTNMIIMMEGNHDFATESIWKKYCDYNPKNLKIYAYNMQPIVVRGRNKNWLYILSHGDLWINKKYDIYRNAINNPYVLFIFRLLDKLSYGIIYKTIATRINQKLIAEFSFFRSDSTCFMSERVAKYRSNIVRILIDMGFATRHTRFCIIEGHYHLGEHIIEENVTYNALQSCYFHKKYLALGNDGFVIEVV